MMAAVLLLCGTQFFPPLFNGSLRWGYVLLVAVLVLLARASRQAYKTDLFKWLFAYLVWCSLTIFWSEIPELSLYKMLAAWLALLSLFVMGHVWGSSLQAADEVWHLYRWLVPAILLVAILGKGGQGLLEEGENYYEGLAGNPNFLGWMMSIIIVPIGWRVMHPGKNDSIYVKYLYRAGLLLGFYYLLSSQSRAAMLTTFIAATAYLFATHSGKRWRIITALLFLGSSAFLLIPALSDTIYSKYVIKGTGQDIAYAWAQSRRGVYDMTMEGAKAGGWLGGGYGISIGSDPSRYSGGLTSVGYGREKGNGALAIIEETGLIGFGILIMLFLHFFKVARKAYRLMSDREEKVRIAVLTGYAAAMLILSNFEAWIVAPGSPESLFFWGYVGVVYALCKRALRQVPEQVVTA
jgi:hypothetical protein